MKKKYIAIICLLSSFVAGCGGRSEAAGEVVRLDEICKHPKHKLVAVEGYLFPGNMTCEGRKKRNASSGTITSCTFNMYPSLDRSGASVAVRIQTAGWLSGNNNGIEVPVEGRDPVIYDNDANPVDFSRKLRINGQLDNADRCILGGVERIDQL